MTKNIKVYSGLSYKQKKSGMEHPKGESLTVPGQSYTLTELLEKHSHGMMPEDVIRSVSFEDDPDIDFSDPSKDPMFDLSDIDVQKEITAELQAKVDEEARAAKNEAAKKAATKEPVSEPPETEKARTKDDTDQEGRLKDPGKEGALK